MVSFEPVVIDPHRLRKGRCRMKKIVVVALFVATFVLTACVPMAAKAPAFPTGKYLMQGNSARGFQWNKDGTWAAQAGDTQLALGTYSVKGDVYTEESNDQNCPSPRHYKYTFDGKKLVFYPVEDPATDPCDGRRGDFNEKVTWLIDTGQ
jgi:hypothetical protein